MSGLDDKKIADDILGKISGGLGGEYEATCPKCGKSGMFKKTMS